MLFQQDKFQESPFMLTPDKIKKGDVIKTTADNFWWIDEIKYKDGMYKFYFDDYQEDLSITQIPPDAKFTVFRQVLD